MTSKSKTTAQGLALGVAAVAFVMSLMTLVLTLAAPATPEPAAKMQGFIGGPVPVGTVKSVGVTPPLASGGTPINLLIEYSNTGCLAGEVWLYDGTTWSCSLPSLTRYVYDCDEDFFGVAPATTTTGGPCLTGVIAASGTISYTGAVLDSTHPGVVVLTSIASAGSRATLVSQGNGFDTIAYGTGVTHVVEIILRLEDLTDATDTVAIRVGHLDAVNSAAQDGAYLEYTVSDPQWQCVTSAAGTRTPVDSAITVAADAWVKLRVEVTGTSTARFYINDVQRCGDITTNIPSGAAQATQIMAQLTRPAGTPTNIRAMYIDKVRAYGFISGGR